MSDKETQDTETRHHAVVEKEEGASSSTHGEYIGYIHNISPIKESRNKKVKYFSCFMQTSKETVRTVSFQADLHEKMNIAADKMSPVKLIGVKRKLKIDGRYGDLELGQHVKLEDSDFPGFEFQTENVPPQKEFSPQKVITLTEVFQMANNDVVSVIGYVTIEGRPKIATIVKNSNHPIARVDAQISENNCLVKLSVWAEKVDEFRNDGVYKLVNVTVREYPFGSGNMFLSTSSRCIISPCSDLEMTAPAMILPELMVRTEILPATSVGSQKFFKCLQCKRNTKVDIVASSYKCAACHVVALATSLSYFYTVKLSFQDGGNQVVVFGPQVEMLFKNIGMSVPADETVLCQQFLCDKKTVLIVDGRNVCVGIQINN